MDLLNSRWIAGVAGLIGLMLAAGGAAAAETQRVLVIHSFGSAAPPFTTHSTAFEATLAQEMGKRVDMDEVSLDMARYAQPDMEAPFVEFLRKRLAKWQPHLVVPIGSPAGRFVAKFRHRLFPETAVIYTGMDRRTLPPDAFEKKATFVGEDFDLAGLVEDILQIAPDTEHIEIILGATTLERYWAVEFRRAFARFTPRVTFNYLNDLSFDQMVERLSKLPPRSFILLGLLLRDAAGVTHNEDDALQRLHAVANAPINGLYQNQLGLGIVGGRLYQGELQGVEAARIAVRILRGEPMSNFPPRIIGTQGPRYDWRELQRWNISEDRLPAGSRVDFRQPTVWQRYRWWLVGIALVGMVQAGLIIQLTVNLVTRRRVERALRESEDRLNLAADSAGAGLWGLDLTSRRIWATPRLRELFDLAPSEELDDQRLLNVVHPADRERVSASLRPAAASSTLNTEFRITRSDGSQRWIATRGHLNGGAGRDREKRWSGVSVDVTERKLVEERLRESESRFRTVADSAPVLIWMSDVDRRCTFFNKPWLDFTGRTLEQELGHGWTERVHPDDLAACLKSYVECFDARRPFVRQYRLRRHDGEYRWISDNGIPRFDGQGSFAGYIGSCLDITDRLRAEEKLETFRQELAHISRVAIVGELMAAMVHELRQPLTAILTNAQAGLRFVATGSHDNDEMRQVLQDIADADRHAAEVIERLRSLFRKGEVERRPLALNQVISDVVSVVFHDAHRRGVSIELDLDPELPLVAGDRIQLQQVILNLVVNAFDAMAGVTDRARRVTIHTAARDGNRARVDVGDTGPGIPLEKLDAIFQPFVSSKAAGMGVGLSVSRSIIDAHEGQLWAESNGDAGAVFHVDLPAILHEAAIR